ncbi:MAG: hypothetical protein M3Z04_11595 [Chloroflexota bacterium]|nr:hypothetical protein [Chloroflexota bacterium]
MNDHQTDWARLDAMTDEEIDTSDIPPLTAEQLARAVWRRPSDGLLEVQVLLEPSVFAWYHRQGKGGDRLLNEALRSYIAAHPVKNG